jgi:putative transposase
MNTRQLAGGMKAARRKASQMLISEEVTVIKDGVGIRRTKHAVYDLKYHLVWIPKYRKQVFTKEISDYLKEVFEQIAEEYGFHIDTMEIMEDHVHIFTEAPPKYAPAEVIQIMKSILAREVFKRYPKLRRQLWAGELWNDGYFVRSVGDEVTADIIRHYIEYQAHEDDSIKLKMFGRS